MNFWHKLQKPFTILAPMEDVTDTVFRQVIIKCGRPDVFYTEFTSVEGLESDGSSQVAKRLKYSEDERPVVAQIWGITPENYYKSVKRVRELGFDGVDLNMGCPQRHIIKNGACSALIKNHSLAKEIFLAMREATEDMPVSIKTRIGFKSIETEDWIGFLLSELKPDALVVHGRTVKEMSKVPNHWEEIAKLYDLRNDCQKDLSEDERTMLIGNGDIESLVDAYDKAKEYRLDGAMIGRAVLQNPWFFKKNKMLITPNHKLELLKFHTELFEKTWEGTKNFNILKKYFKVYINGFKGAKELRINLMESNDYKEVYQIIDAYKHEQQQVFL